MFVIKNMKTGKYLWGTDYRYPRPHQRTSKERLIGWDTEKEAEWNLVSRQCGKDYKVVEIRIMEVE